MNVQFILLIFVSFWMNCTRDPITMKHATQTSLLESVKANKLTLVEQALKDGANVNTQDATGSSLLLIATRNSYEEMARLLVAQGADVNLQDRSKDSPFLLAGAAGNVELVKLFLANGARFDLFNRYNGTALIPACERGHIAVVKILANTKGFPIDHINRLGWTALLEAVILGDGTAKYINVIQILVDAGCDIHIADADGISALQHAKKRGYTKMIQVLVHAANR